MMSKRSTTVASLAIAALLAVSCGSKPATTASGSTPPTRALGQTSVADGTTTTTGSTPARPTQTTAARLSASGGPPPIVLPTTFWPTSTQVAIGQLIEVSAQPEEGVTQADGSSFQPATPVSLANGVLRLLDRSTSCAGPSPCFRFIAIGEGTADLVQTRPAGYIWLFAPIRGSLWGAAG